MIEQHLPRAYSYIRFSTPEQEKGDSLRRQAELSEKYALEHGLQLDKTLSFRDLGVSAFNKSNLRNGGQLRAFLDAIDQGIVLPGSYLLVESLDRISRAEILDALEIFTGILNRGITVVTLADNMTYSKEKANKQFTDLIISITIMSRAHEESLTKSKRLKEAWAAKRKQAPVKKMTSTCPAWLSLNQSRTEYEFIPEKVAIVKQIVDLMMSGMGRNGIAKKFNLEGVPSIGNRGKEKTWFPSYIVKIVKNRSLIGEFQPRKTLDGKRGIAVGEPISDYFPRVISNEQFALLQQLISERGRNSGGNRGKQFSNLFTGFVKCGYCGSAMVYVNKGSGKKSDDPKYSRFLVCSKSKRGAGCQYVPWVYDDLEESFLYYAKGIDFSRFVSDASDQTKTVKAISDQIAVHRVQRDDLLRRNERLVAAIEDADEQPKSLIEKILGYELEITEVERQMVLLESDLRAAKSLQSIAQETLEIIQELIDQMHEKKGEDRFLFRARINEHLRRIIRELVLFPGGTIHTAEEVESIRQELSTSGRYSKADIENYVEVALPIKPNKEERYFVIKNRDQAIQVLKPEHTFPDIMDTLATHPELVHHWIRKQRARIGVAE
jgi:DNA invertase Pin-like site-specific DNA recombinase